MSTPNPLVPQGTNPNAPKVKSNIKIAVATILAIHVVLFGGLLLQGCKPDSQTVSTEQATNALPAFDPGAFAAQQQVQPAPDQPAVPIAPPIDPIAVPAISAAALGQPAPQAGLAPAPDPTAPPTILPPTASAGEYTVKKGDYFEKIARENRTTVKALTAANPGVDSRKLKINQKLVLPPPSATPSATASVAAETAPAGFQVYSVKSGDSLTKIAGLHKTSVKALRAANNLKTDNIRVGQKLKVPVKTVAEAPPAVLPQASVPVSSTPGAPAGGQ